ncbi:DUF421 domain-containing protein [Cytobacillus sp. FJAT-54145]|uniref:DUF421 domain-containing protein n=1 Tax=Cytobacillus spartinae TaxID=3299023 RepID=A0ABW6K5W6_9BACI
MPHWLQAVVYITAAIILLRVGGKRAISQTTPSEVVLMIGIGTVLVHPLKEENSWESVYNGSLIILGLIFVSYLQILIPKTKKWIMGEPLLLIEEGRVIEKNLRKARIPEDELKMRLRIKKINDIKSVKSASLEVSGEIGVELFPNETYATKKDLEDIKYALNVISTKLNCPLTFNPPSPKDSDDNLFKQVKKVQYKDPTQ